jgi:hypothetical protein
MSVCSGITCFRLPTSASLGTPNWHLPSVSSFRFDVSAGGNWLMNIYVGNLSYDATEEDIRTAFSQFGAVDAVNIIKDRETGRSRGFCFVEMPDDEEAKSAIEGLNLQRIAGRAVTVNEARPRRERSGGGGRGHGGGGRRW